MLYILSPMLLLCAIMQTTETTDTDNTENTEEETPCEINGFEF